MPIRTTYDTGDAFDDIKESVEAHERHIKAQIRDLGAKTVQKMKDVIKANKKRPQAGEPTTLEDLIDVEYFADGSGWGVGDIQLLNQKFPGWRAVNFGSRHMVGRMLPMGLFNPDPDDGRPNDANFRKGRWKAGQGTFTAVVKRPIPAMNYIQKTVNFVRRQVNNIRLRGK